jgi:hypothetical protein
MWSLASGPGASVALPFRKIKPEPDERAMDPAPRTLGTRDDGAGTFNIVLALATGASKPLVQLTLAAVCGSKPASAAVLANPTCERDDSDGECASGATLRWAHVRVRLVGDR